MARRARDLAIDEGVRTARGVHAPAGPGAVAVRVLEHAWDYEYENQLQRRRRVRATSLGRKIDQPFGADSIETVRGAGYRLRKDA